MADKVKLTSLWKRQSARGTEYFTGFLGAASVVLLKDEAESAAKGREVWSLYAETPRPRPAAIGGAPEGQAAPGEAYPYPAPKKRARTPQTRARARTAPRASAAPPPGPMPDDPIPF